MHIRPKLGKNPFAVPGSCWQITFHVPAEFVLPLEETLSDMAIAISSFEEDEAKRRWSVRIMTDHPPKMEEVEKRVAMLSEIFFVPPPKAEVATLPSEGWLSAVARDFPPLSVGQFFVHGGHAKHLLPLHAIGLQIEAGMAFGSGEHATTSGCLELLDRLARKHRFERILDVGCGSGILAIAAAKLWPRAHVVAVDIDPISVRVAADNARINGVSGTVEIEVADGYDAPLVRRGRPYDLILSNILARPLVQLSRDLASHLRPRGYAILSGLLEAQEPQVLAAHRRQGLKFAGRLSKTGWNTLLLKK